MLSLAHGHKCQTRKVAELQKAIDGKMCRVGGDVHLPRRPGMDQDGRRARLHAADGVMHAGCRSGDLLCLRG